MTLDWGSTAAERARDAQTRAGWSDDELLARLLGVLRAGPTGDIRELRGRVETEYDDLPPGTSATDRIGFLTDRLPALSGPWATQGLDGLLRETRPEPADRPRVTWDSTALEHAREAQERAGLSDEQLVERFLEVLRDGATPEIRNVAPDLRAAYDALPADTSAADRVQLLARGLPTLSGSRADVFLVDLLLGTGAGRVKPATRSSYSFYRDWRRGLVLMVGTWVVLGAISVLIVRLG